MKDIGIAFFSLVIGLFLLSGVQSSFSQESLEELSDEDLRLIEEYLDQAKTLFEQRYTESTIFHYDKVLAIDPLNIDALNGKAFVLDFVGSHEDAISYYDEVLLINSKNNDALLGKALALDNHGKSEEAMVYFDKTLKIEEIQQPIQDISDKDLEFLEISFELAQELFEGEHYDEAISYYDLVLEIIPSDIDALIGKAIALESIGNHEESILFYDKVLAIDLSDIDALNGKAIALGSIGNHKEAISFYDKALAIDSTYIDALFGKALSLEKIGRGDESLSNLEKIETIIPSDVEFREPEEIINENVAKVIVEFDQILFVIIGVFIIILVSIILVDFIVKRKKSLASAEIPK